MKILQVIPYFTPKRGGDVNVCYHLSKSLADMGHEVTIITTDFEFDAEYAGTLKQKNIRIIPFSSVKNFQLFLYSPEMKTWVKENLRKFDIVHAHEFRTYQNIIIAKYAKKANVPLILQPHNDLPRSVEKKLLKTLFDFVVGNKILKVSRKIIAVSEQESLVAENLGFKAADISLIYNGLDTTLFENEIGFENKKNSFPIRKTLLYFGRVHKSKGIDNIINSFRDVLKKYPDCNLIIAGADGGYQNTLEGMIKKFHIESNVQFLDYVDEKKKQDIFRSSHVLLHPVLFMGGVGLIPLEAVLCETPVIVTKECGEIIEKCGCGYIVTYGDIEELTSTIFRIFENYPEAKQKAIEGRKYLLKHFSWDVVVKEYGKIYQSVKR